MINVGIDWAEAHHDVCVEDDEGNVLAKARVPEGIEGLERIHEMLGVHAAEASEVAIGIELDRGLLVGALVAARRVSQDARQEVCSTTHPTSPRDSGHVQAPGRALIPPAERAS